MEANESKYQKIFSDHCDDIWPSNFEFLTELADCCPIHLDNTIRSKDMELCFSKYDRFRLKHGKRKQNRMSGV